MNEEASTQQEPTWQRRCERCGHELASVVTNVFPGGDEQLDIPVAQDVCPNPECPAKDSGTDVTEGPRP
jgi:hypothetical protein